MDISYLLWLQGLRESAPDAIQAFLSFVGSEAATVLTMLIPCVMYWCIDKRRSTLALITYGVSSVFNQLIKNTVCCYRPWVRDRAWCLTRLRSRVPRATRSLAPTRSLRRASWEALAGLGARGVGRWWSA